MDNLKQLGRRWRKDKKESDDNIRRYSENIPLMHRSVDHLTPEQSYYLDFPLSDRPHKVTMWLGIEEPPEECVIEPIDVIAQSVTECPQFADYFNASGAWVVGTDEQFVSEVGGFAISSDGGVILPLTGIYTIHYTNLVVGVTTAPLEVHGKITHNGGTIAQQTLLGRCPNSDPEVYLCFFSNSFDMHASVAAAAGDVISVWHQAPPSLVNYTPSNFCGILGVGEMVITLVAEA